MLFNSVEFLFFLPTVFFIYWFVVNRKLPLQNLFVVIASYIFYGWWDSRFLLLIACTSFFSWLSGIGIRAVRNNSLPEEAVKTRRKAKAIVAGNVILNVAILGFFKYYNFFVENFVEAFQLIGMDLHIRTLAIILPVGISFYTFQALSYTIDVYRKRIKPTEDIVAFFAFVSFFPQLVAGPIERANHLLKQFYIPRRLTYENAVTGGRLILWGLFKKMVIADNCAVVVDDIFANYAVYSGSTLLLGAFLFAFQIYGDFSGYSDIAIGTAKLFGIELRKNFYYPYFSKNIAEFWKRWHISLNTWFVDYVYIPLGGSREGKYKHIRNVFIIFLLSGLWHGANWTFIGWGLYHAILFVPFVFIESTSAYTNRWFHSYGSMLITFVLVLFGWILFRADNIQIAWQYIQTIFSYSLLTIPKVAGVKNTYALLSLFFIFVMLLFEWVHRNKEFGLDLSIGLSRVKRYSIYSFLVMLLYFFGAKSSDFIYFQF